MKTDETPVCGEAAAGRRHDFDALRSGAMLLGIALHAGLAFAPVPWLAMNDATSPAIGTMIEVLHGFRLPLFFIMSGFFSAMLLQRRGVRGFLFHRGRRIVLPLILGSFTIIPAMWGVIIGGNALQHQFPAAAREWAKPVDSEETVWRAAARGDLESLQELVRAGSRVDQPDPQFFTLPLAWAATGDHADVVVYLLEQGADPNQLMGDENTPMHTAFFYGAHASALLMLEAGGDVSQSNKHGETPVGAMRHDEQIVAFISNLLGVDASFERVEAGRAKLIAMLDARGGERSPVRALGDRVMGFLHGEVLLHLWFLWHLCWLAGGLVVLRLLFWFLPRLSMPEVLVSTPLCLVGLVPLTALTQSWQANFGPDTSAAILPASHVLLHYAVFFGFGVVMYRSRTAADRLGRAWWAHLPLAVVSCVGALEVLHGGEILDGLGLSPEVRSWVGPVLQAAFVWTIAFGLIGLSRSLLSRANGRIRYLSDASYWLYLAHLPLVVAGQFAFAYVSFHPMVEFIALTVVSTALLLLSYRWCVRYTWIGRMLNGRRVRPVVSKVSALAAER